MRAAAQARRAAGERVAVLVRSAEADRLGALDAEVIRLGDDLDRIAHDLFAILRSLDERAVDVVIVRQFERTGLGHALADRLRRAADGREIDVPAHGPGGSPR